MIRATGLTLAAVLCLGAAAPESRLEEYFRLRKEAGAAANGGDLARAEVLLERALFLYPTAPGSFIRLARLEAAAGKPHEAVAHLASYANLGLTWDVAGDKALATLAGRDDFALVAARLAANAKPVGNPTLVAELPEAGPIYEGLARRADDWLISSVTDRTIYRIDGKGRSPFLVDTPLTGGIFGLAVDGGTVWAAEASGPEIPGSQGPARTALLRIDGRTGVILDRYPLPDDGKPHQLGDVTVATDGAVYASDSVGAGIWRLKPGSKLLEPILHSKDLGSPQGMVVCEAADALLIADYPTGLHRLDLKSGKLEPVGGMKVALAGTDGLFRVGYEHSRRNAKPQPLAVVATQNGVTPARLVMLRISPDCRRIEAATVMAANHEGLDDLTLGADDAGRVAVIAGSGWTGYGPDGKQTPGATPKAARILAFPYPAD